MATQLDLQEQEQLDALKAFWGRYGNLITWLLIILLGAYAGWFWWHNRQAEQALKASSMYDALEQAALAGDADRAGRVFGDLQKDFARTTFAAQGGLEAAKVEFEKGKVDAAKASLTWVAEQASDDEYRSVARLRLAALLAGAKEYDAALKQLDAVGSGPFDALAADRRGDILSLAGRKDEARSAYQAAWKAMDPKTEYRVLIEAKLTALGAAPTPAATASGATP